jgi:phosphate:Na+ symporter
LTLFPGKDVIPGDPTILVAVVSGRGAAMSATQVVLRLLGDVALLLWGIHMVHSGLLRAFGSEFRHALAIGLKSRVSAFFSGIAVTALLQSSTATAMLATSFLGDPAVSLAAALALMLGANVGSALIVQALSFDITLVFPVLIFAGMVAFKNGRRSRVRDIGRAVIGLGLMLLALHLLAEAMQPVEGAAAVRALLASLTSDPLINLVLAAALTWAAHSSVATVLFVISLATAGLVSPAGAMAMVVGANIGSALNPLIGSGQGEPAKRRLALGNMINRVGGALVALPLLPYLARAAEGWSSAPVVAGFHLGFNIATAAAFMLVLPALARLLTRMIPDRLDADDPATPKYLHESALDTPAVALSNAAREALRMADVVDEMLRGSQDAFRMADRKRVHAVGQMDNILDRLHEVIERYLTQLDGDSLTEAEAKRLSDVLAFVIAMEHTGDVVEKSLMKLAAKQIKKRILLSAEAQEQIATLHGRLIDDLRLATAVFHGGDVAAARALAHEKEFFRESERTVTERHFDRVLTGREEAHEASGLHLDVVRDLKRISAHIISVGYPILEQSDMLRQSRLMEQRQPE